MILHLKFAAFLSRNLQWLTHWTHNVLISVAR